MGLVSFISNRTVLSTSSGLTLWILRLGIFTTAITIAVMVMASAIINGFQTQIQEKIFGFWGHVQISNLSISENYEGVPVKVTTGMMDTLRNIEEVTITKRSGDRYSTKGGIRHVQTTAMLPGIIKGDDLLEGIILKGIDENFDLAFFDNFLKQGDALRVGESSMDKAVISEQTAARTGLQLGDRLDLYFVIGRKQFPRKFTVAGIYRTGLEEYDRKFILVDIGEVKQLINWNENEVGEIEIFVDHIEDAPLIADYIYYEVIPDDLYAESIKDKYPGIFEWLELQSVNEIVILGLMLIVCILNMVTILLILILEKTNMIGILKALGANNWTLRQLFLGQGFYILFRGLIIGNILGIGICFIQKWTGFLSLNEADYYLATVPVDFDWVFIGLINAGTILAVLLFLLLPTVLVAKISPVKVIQFK
ncbi:MAG: FtsX-like permease family protein [Saprospiraceae bacterium]|nr:FtsX-like permease family protein [Saprospiraceae bacterium]